jgi:hypothetical protein
MSSSGASGNAAGGGGTDGSGGGSSSRMSPRSKSGSVGPASGSPNRGVPPRNNSGNLSPLRGTSSTAAPRLPPRTRSGQRMAMNRSKSMEAPTKWVRESSSRRMTPEEESDFDLGSFGQDASSRLTAGTSRAMVSKTTPHPSRSSSSGGGERKKKPPRSSLDPMSIVGVGAAASASAATESDRDLLMEESMRIGADEPDSDPDSHADAPVTTGAALRSKHSTAVAIRFLEDQEDADADDFDLGGTPNNRSVADFHMSQLRFPTIGAGGDRVATSIFEDESESTSHDQPETSRFYKKMSAANKIPETNVFASRQDLREVDQSVNL